MPDLIGKTLGGYRIIEQIGLGGMATVFKAFQPSMDRYVALKVISTHLTQDPTFVKRFRQEAKVIAKLEHLHILPVYDHGEEDGYLYLVMRFIQAGTLKDRLKGDPLSLDEARRVVNQIGSALEYAHQLGVVHRDLKPSNVLIDPQGDCYLTDFGIAKMVEGTLGLTGSGVLGTPHYMAPEQSQSLKVDHRADVYAMGVVLYEMVTGRVPFDAETPFAVVMKHISEPLPLPRSVKPDLPESVERVILRALAKDPADRYQSMRDLVATFDRAVRAAPAEARTAAPTSPAPPAPTVVTEAEVEPTAVVPPSAPVSAWRRWAGAQPLWLLAVAGLGLVVLVLAGLILSRVPGRVEITGGQVQVVLPTATATPTVEAAAVATPTPQPTSTPTPRPTAALAVTSIPSSPADQAHAFAEPILAAIADRPPDYEDDFSDPASGWPIGSTADGDEWGYEDDAYFISATYLPQGKCCIGAGPDSAPLFSDFVLELDAQFISGKSDLWGVIFRDLGGIAEPADHYAVGFWPDGHFRVWKNIGGNHLELLEVNASPVAFEQGFETNHLTIIAQGPQIGFYVNREPLWFIYDESVSRGGIQLLVENTEADSSLRVHFDNLKVWDISDLSQPSAEVTPAPQPTATPTPNPVADQAQSFAEPILAAIAGRPPDYEDDFDHPSDDWPSGPGISGHPSHVEGEMGFDGGEYFATAGARGREQWACYGGDSLTSFPADFVLDITGRLMPSTDPSGDGDWQIQFRKWEFGGFYVLIVSQDRGVGLVRHGPGEGEEVGLANYPAPFGDISEANRFQIIARGSETAIYLNGEPLFYVNDSGYSDRYGAGTINLGVCNLSDAPLQARWDNLRIWDISDLALPSAEVGECRITYEQDGDIYVRNCDGSNEYRLTDDLAGDWLPAWSPDGTQIVFGSNRDAGGEDRNQIYVMDADGYNQTRLTHTDINEEHPSWSPDGGRIAFHSGCSLAVVNADGSNWTTLVEARDDLCVGFPTWSPDSRRIAFRSLILSEGTGLWQHDIYVVNDNGSKLLKLAAFTSEERSRYTVWSPDGGRVAFDVVLDGQRRYYAVNSDGSSEPVEIPSIPDSWYPWYWPQWAGETTVAPPINPTDRRGQLVNCGDDLCVQTTDGSSVPLGLSASYTQFSRYTWSPDGSQIAFSACLLGNEDKCEELYVADLDNGAVVRLPRQGENHHPLVPAWSPNGEWIAYHDSGALSVVRPDGTGHREIVPHPYCPTNIAWSPDSSRLAWFAHWCDEDETSPALLLVVNFDGGDMRLLWTRDANPHGSDVAFSPDGAYLAVRFDDGSAYRVDPECDPGPDGCDESSRTEMNDFPERWLHTYWPQWEGEQAAAPTPAPGSPAEQARAFAEPILAAIADRSPDYTDDFGNSGSGWEVGTRDEKETGWEGGETGYADGTYFVRASPAYHAHQAGRVTCNSGRSSVLPEFSDLVIEVDGRFVSGEKGDWQVHLRNWSEQTLTEDSNGGYAVTIEPGRANILRNENWQTVSLAEAQSSIVKRGFETNHLQIVARGAQIAVLVNGKLVAFATDPNPFERGTVGLIVCNFGDVPLEARWDNLRIWDISGLALP